MASPKGKMIVRYDHASPNGESMYTLLIKVGAGARPDELVVYDSPLFAHNRRSMLEKIVEMVREYTPEELYVALPQRDTEKAISKETLKAIVEGKLDAEDLLLGS